MVKFSIQQRRTACVGGELSGPLSDRIRILTFLCFLIGFDTDLLRLTKHHILFFIKIDPQKKKIISVKC